LLFAPLPTTLTDEQKQDEMRTRRGALAQAFLPYLQQQLSRQLIVQTFSAGAATDPALIEALLTDAGLLKEPGHPGAPLLDAFAALGHSGVTAAFFPTTDATGTATETRTTADVATAGKPAGSNSARFEGYLEVAAPGAYRFVAKLDRQNATAELRFAHRPDPLLRDTAAADDAEISDFIELDHGTPYRFTFEAGSLGTGDVRLLVQGEGLPKDSLSRLTLYPWAAVERAAQAQVLFAKALQIIAALGLNEREVRYLLAHPADFDNLDLSALPTRAENDSPAAVQALFDQFRRLAGYARLKRDLAVEGDDLILIFENAHRTYPAGANAAAAESEVLTAVVARTADLTRRDAATVSATAAQLGYRGISTATAGGLSVQAAGFTDELGLRRLWQLLQVVQTLGVPVESLAHWAHPQPDAGIAADLRDTVKARYEPETWQRIAQPIFDTLRQHQRDALVAYLMQRDGYERLEQLYEYFLVDPGMEPVVQTSRIQLAIASVQLFIQRCLLNLELEVHPSLINSDHWRWMKRYRVWEANRKIFLFPENWLEPEFRDDKTNRQCCIWSVPGMLKRRPWSGVRSPRPARRT
jgi:hypothetical protein